MDNQRNFLLAAVLSLGVVFAWQALIVQPRIDRERAIAEQQAAQNPAPAGEATTPSTAGNPDVVGVPSGQNPATPSAIPGSQPSGDTNTRSAGRVELTSGKLAGSINLRGARIDDLRLLDYTETVDPASDKIRLLSPAGSPDAYFAEFGYSPNPALGDLPGPSTVWSQVNSGTLTPDNPAVLEYTNPQGLTFQRTISVDENYMFTVRDSVANSGSAPIAVQPYGRIARFGEPETEGIYVLHEGLIGAIGDQGLDEIDYDDIMEDRQIIRQRASQGWIGMTDKYWATALIPGGQSFIAHYNYFERDRSFYQTDFLSDSVTVPAGGTAEVTNRLFAGAKTVGLLDEYSEGLNIPLFDKLIDWGWFYWITKPLFFAMDYFYHLVGNFGVAILIVTVLLKLLFFPLANKSYASMANMKKMQPEMTAIRERFADDRPAQQKAMMELYKKEKINPAAGCWPVLIQIPVFFALYKVLYVTIEMRHAPFFGWINDLSAPDPTSILNLFGLLPYDSPAFLAILAVGVWPLIMGITMFVQMQMNPAPPDPTQQMIFKWMPVVFTFMLATFPAGLVIYWAWNNFLSILQQGTIMKRQGAKIELWDNLKGMFIRKQKAE